MDAVLQAVPRTRKKEKGPKPPSDEQLPDVFAETQARTPEDCEQWLAGFEIPVLKGLVRKHDLDSSGRSRKWREPEKFAKLIAEQIRARMQRGSAFLTSTVPPEVKR
jgi:hypothetical protein